MAERMPLGPRASRSHNRGGVTAPSWATLSLQKRRPAHRSCCKPFPLPHSRSSARSFPAGKPREAASRVEKSLKSERQGLKTAQLHGTLPCLALLTPVGRTLTSSLPTTTCPKLHPAHQVSSWRRNYDKSWGLEFADAAEGVARGRRRHVASHPFGHEWLAGCSGSRVDQNGSQSTEVSGPCPVRLLGGPKCNFHTRPVQRKPGMKEDTQRVIMNRPC